MSSSAITLDRPLESATTEREQQVAKLTRAMYPADRQEKFLELQAEVETLLCQLQALQRIPS
jgi:hypothetical protein